MGGKGKDFLSRKLLDFVILFSSETRRQSVISRLITP
jgi:hypothetical protein